MFICCDASHMSLHLFFSVRHSLSDFISHFNFYFTSLKTLYKMTCKLIKEQATIMLINIRTNTLNKTPPHTHQSTHSHTAHIFVLPGGSFKAWLLAPFQAATLKNRHTTFWVVLQPQQQQYQERIRTLAKYIHTHCKCHCETQAVSTL